MSDDDTAPQCLLCLGNADNCKHSCWKPCDSGLCNGWGVGDEFQRCDTCKRFASDDEAWAHVLGCDDCLDEMLTTARDNGYNCKHPRLQMADTKETDTMRAVTNLRLGPEAQDEIFKTLAAYDRKIDRLASRLGPVDTVAMAAAKFEADRTICRILAILAEARS